GPGVVRSGYSVLAARLSCAANLFCRWVALILRRVSALKRHPRGLPPRLLFSRAARALAGDRILPNRWAACRRNASAVLSSGGASSNAVLWAGCVFMAPITPCWESPVKPRRVVTPSCGEVSEWCKLPHLTHYPTLGNVSAVDM